MVVSAGEHMGFTSVALLFYSKKYKARVVPSLS